MAKGKKLASLEKQLFAKFDEIVRCLAEVLGMDLTAQRSELEEEAESCIEAWMEGPDMALLTPETPFQRLLSEYCDLQDAILDIRDAKFQKRQ